MKEFFEKYKAYLPLFVMISLFAGMGLIAWFGIVPFERFITEKADGIQEYYASQENRERQIGKLPELEAQFQNILADERGLAILLQEDRIVDFVKTLERLAVETEVHVTIQSKNSEVIEEKKAPKPVVKKVTTPDSADEGAPKKEEGTILEMLPYDRFLHVNVVVIGEYKNIVTFLHRMETLPLGLDVIGMALRTRNAEETETAGVEPVGRNPFLMLSGGEVAESSEDAEKEKVIPGSLEASFDTVVYLSK